MNARDSDNPKLRVRGATKVYPTGSGDLLAIDRCSLDVQAGEIVSIVGPSGCGKTTLLWSMSGLHGLTSGDGAARRQADHGPESRDRHGVPGGQPAALAQPRRQHPLPFEIKGTKPDRDWIDELLHTRRARRLRRAVSARTVRRHAAARRAGPRAVVQALGAADGRAVRRARRLHPRGDEPAGRGDLARTRPPSSSSPTRSRRRSSSPTA